MCAPAERRGAHPHTVASLAASAARGRAVEVVRDLIERLPVSVVDLDEEIATEAALLRARHPSLKLPDALVVATAEHSSAGHLITSDRKWLTAKAMKLTVSIQRI